MTITCPHCQQQSKVSDQIAGKQVKCGGCGRGFVATVVPLKAAPQTQSPRVHIQPKYVVLAALVVVITTTLTLYQSHPRKVAQQITELQPRAELDIKDVVERGLQAYMAEQGLFDRTQPRGLAHALEVSFLWSPMYWNMPEKVGIVGATSQGAFGGNYFPKTGEVEADVDIGGYGVPAAGALKRGETRIHVTGRVQASSVTVEVNGKPIHPPRTIRP